MRRFLIALTVMLLLILSIGLGIAIATWGLRPAIPQTTSPADTPTR